MTEKKNKKPVAVAMLVSINGGPPTKMDFDSEAHAKIAQAEMNDWYGRYYVRTKFIYKD